MNKEYIVEELNKLQSKYIGDGVIFCGIFGSYARDEEKTNSDIDVAYNLNRDVFSKKYKGFKAVSKIAEISDELSRHFGKNVDFVSVDSTNQELNRAIKKELYK